MTGLYKISTLSRMTGISAANLRAWERRHALLEPQRTEGGHRLYTKDDLTVLGRVQLLLSEGRSIGEIASAGRSALLEQGSPSQKGPPENLELDLSLFEVWQSKICEAACAIDGQALQAILDQAFAATEPVRVIDGLIIPASERVGELWAQGICSVAGEHLASNLFQGRIDKLFHSINPSWSDAPPVICACLPDEQHELGALVLAYLLARQGRRVSYLGAALPIEDLRKAIDLVDPDLVFLSTTSEVVYRAARAALIDLASAHRTRPRFLIGGPGTPERDPAMQMVGVQLVHERPNDERIRTLLSEGP